MSAPELDRRRMLALMAGSCAACLTGGGPFPALAQDAAAPGTLLPPGEEGLAPVKARWWKKKEGLVVECGLCPHRCLVADIERGTCGVRENRGGTYYTLVHSRPCSLAIDPIEKKPLFHVLPGTRALSLATTGCNFECKFCQNWEIAQARPEQIKSVPLTPSQVVALAKSRGTPTIACTYTEPVVWSEYVYDIAAESRKAGIRTTIISNGYIEEEPLGDLCAVLGAVKIDLKAFTQKFYEDQCKGDLKPVLDTLRRLKKKGMWFEIVDLIVPTLNDGVDEIRALSKFVKEELGPEVPVHFSRFRPYYRLMNLPSTPIATLERAHRVATEVGLHYVYVGNVPGHPTESTYCPVCKKRLIHRTGYAIIENQLKSGSCPNCGHKQAGIWS